MMNSQFLIDRAHDFAVRIRQEAGDHLAEQVRLAWRLAFAAEATDEELVASRQFVQELAAYFAAHPPADEKEKKKHDPQLEALASFGHALLSSNRFLYW